MSEVVAADDLMSAREALAKTIAAQPPASVQATLRTLWAASSLSPEQALGLGNVFLQLGTTAKALREGQELCANERPKQWRLR